jgi:hypothetical protein
LTESGTIEKVRARQGIISKIQNFITLGYGTKEDLRELDNKLRNLYYQDLNRMRYLWGDVYLAVLERGGLGRKRDLKKVIQVLDRIMEKVRHADYGYAGLFDRKGHIRENELSRVFDYDQTLNDEIDNLNDMIQKIHSDIESERWEWVPDEVRRIKNLLLTFESKWIERERVYRPLEI